MSGQKPANKPVKDGLKVRFPQNVEDWMKMRATKLKFANVQDYIRDLVRLDQLGKVQR
jgi:Arc/MetJ-type ribon-helix-helix transcriptional regulator